MSGYNVWSDAQLELKHTSVRSRTIHTYAFSFAHIQKHESSSFDVIERDIRESQFMLNKSRMLLFRCYRKLFELFPNRALAIAAVSML
jgi:hypothetical protein